MRQEEVENITLKAIANELFISSSTVIRACKKLGYQTYNELRYDLRLSKELKKNQAKLEHNSFEQLKEQLHVEFEHTLSILSEQDFQSFADKILEARRIFCIGVGSSYMPMTDFNRKLKLINIWTNDYFEQFSIERIKVIVTPQDVIISILQAKRHGATVLTITTLGNHLLSKISDHMIFVYDAPKNVKICVRI